MHIAHFTNFYYPVINGVVRSVGAFREAMTELGHNVFIFAQHDPNYTDDEPFIYRYPAIKLPLQVEIPTIIPVSPFIDKLLPTLKLDVIHTHHPFLLGQTAATKSDDLGVPLVFTFHTQYTDYSHYFPLPQEAVQSFVKDAIVTWMADFMQKCHHIVVPSESMAEILREGYGLEDQVTAIPTGINLAPYKTADRDAVRRRHNWNQDRVVISVGRLAPEKNFETLINAVGRILPRLPDLRLVIIGDGPSRTKLEKLAEKRGLAGRVEFLGTLPYSEIPAYLKAADLFGFASITETQGLATMEAQAAGLPVAAVDATGTSDAVTHLREGLLTPNSAAALGNAIEKILTDETLRRRFRAAALEKAATFDISLITPRLIEVYKQAVIDQKANRKVCLTKSNKLFKIDWTQIPLLHT